MNSILQRSKRTPKWSSLSFHGNEECPWCGLTLHRYAQLSLQKRFPIDTCRIPPLLSSKEQENHRPPHWRHPWLCPINKDLFPGHLLRSQQQTSLIISTCLASSMLLAWQEKTIWPFFFLSSSIFIFSYSNKKKIVSTLIA